MKFLSAVGLLAILSSYGQDPQTVEQLTFLPAEHRAAIVEVASIVNGDLVDELMLEIQINLDQL